MSDWFGPLNYVGRIMFIAACVSFLIVAVVSWYQIVRQGRSAQTPTWMAGWAGAVGAMLGLEPVGNLIGEATRNVVWPEFYTLQAVALGVSYYIVLPILPGLLGILPVAIVRRILARWGSGASAASEPDS